MQLTIQYDAITVFYVVISGEKCTSVAYRLITIIEMSLLVRCVVLEPNRLLSKTRLNVAERGQIWPTTNDQLRMAKYGLHVAIHMAKRG